MIQTRHHKIKGKLTLHAYSYLASSSSFVEALLTIFPVSYHQGSGNMQNTVKMANSIEKTLTIFKSHLKTKKD